MPGSNHVVAVVGLGYVGLPLALELGKKFKTIGYDRSKSKILELNRHFDSTGEVAGAQFKLAHFVEFSDDPACLSAAEMIVIAVPTPVDAARNPDFEPLRSACDVVGRFMSHGTTVIFESTVYPGATEEVCIPILERASGLEWREGFHVGYSPERINPSDKKHTLTKIVKLVAGDNDRTLERVASLYGAIIDAGVFRVSSIKVAEAAKVIENTQRDINIAMVNELAMIFHRLDIDTVEVLEAAGTKWNFLPFRPGLVGGHCIGVDPYYLTYKAETVGYHPQMILAGRRINDGMGKYVAEQTVKEMIKAGLSIGGASVNVLGLTFKENCSDLRNSRVIDVIGELQSYGVNVIVHDPVCSSSEAKDEYGISLCEWDKLPRAEATIFAVVHQELAKRPVFDWVGITAIGGCVIDVKSALPAQQLREAGLRVWRL